MSNYLSINNNQSVPISSIPVLTYADFYDSLLALMDNHPERHCVNYYGYRIDNQIKLIGCVADDQTHQIYVLSCLVKPDDKLQSLTAQLLCFERFEREIHENFGIVFLEHPWLKPVRYAFDRANSSLTMANYPFYSIDSEELHEVGVGPIHAGIIEPGHFRFICNGEQILHLEIQLGYQHRGIEHQMVQAKNLPQRTIIAESIAGDTVVGHTLAFANVFESLCGFTASEDLVYARHLALELERMAIHTGDLSAVCTDVAYQLGSSVLGRLRTPLVNFMQEWCGNRLSKGFVRPFRNAYPFSQQLANRLNQLLDAYEPDFEEMNDELFRLPSALSRFERTGVVSHDDLLKIGTVGLSARMGGLMRDIRWSHPTGLYSSLEHDPIVKHHGDVYSRVQLRRLEVEQSMTYIRNWMETIPSISGKIPGDLEMAANHFSISLVEGWRGEICHCAIIGENGQLLHYKIKDPSFHNWLALALAVRNNEISDFPICNKSFNLSYAGHDL